MTPILFLVGFASGGVVGMMILWGYLIWLHETNRVELEAAFVRARIRIEETRIGKLGGIAMKGWKRSF